MLPRTLRFFVIGAPRDERDAEDIDAVKKVLAAVDLTAVGRRVADRARLVAEEHGSSLTLVHVFDPAEGALLDSEEMALFKRTATERAHELADWVRARTTVQVDLAIPSGSPATHVARLAKRADLIVAGTSSLDAGKVGPVTRRLARKARTGLLAVRRQPRRSYQRVLATVDLSDTSRAALDLAFELAPGADVFAAYALVSRFDQMLIDSGRSSSEVEKMHVRRMGKAKEALEAFVSSHPGVKSIVVSGPPSTALSEMARRRSVDLVTAASKGSGSSSLVLLGTVAEEVLEAAHCDVAIASVNAPFRRP